MIILSHYQNNALSSQKKTLPPLITSFTSSRLIKIPIHSRLTVPCREVRECWITEASEATIIVGEISERKASQRQKEVLS